MKVKDLIEKLIGYEDFEVETTIYSQPYAGARGYWLSYSITGITDIGHSNKVIVLDADYKGDF